VLKVHTGNFRLGILVEVNLNGCSQTFGTSCFGAKKMQWTPAIFRKFCRPAEEKKAAGPGSRSWLQRFVLAFSRLCKLFLVGSFGFFGGLWLVACPALNKRLCDQMLFRSVPYPLGPYNSQTIGNILREEAFLPVTDQPNSPVLHAWYFAVPNAKRAVVFHHGQLGNVSTYSKMLQVWLNMGFSVVIYDYEGYGRSTGHSSISMLRVDGEAPYRWLISTKGFKPGQIIHVGCSLGTSSAALIGSRLPCAGVILISPYASLLQVAHRAMPLLNLWPDALIGYPDIGAEEPLSRPHPPTLILAGVKDSEIPIEQADQIYRRADKRNLFYARLENSGHTDCFWVQPKETTKAIADFIARLH
jgi:uncharacterized protein